MKMVVDSYKTCAMHSGKSKPNINEVINKAKVDKENIDIKSLGQR